MLSRSLLEDYYAWLQLPENGLHGRRRSADTARKIVEVAQLAWEWAEASERWPGDVPRPRKIEMVRRIPDRVFAPTWFEMDQMVAASRGWLRKLVTVLRYTGLRVGETMLLTWDNVNLAAGRLTIPGAISKTGQGRTVPISQHLVDELAGWGLRSGYLVPCGRRDGERERQARPRDAQRAWTRAGVRSEAWEGEPFHAFRNGFKSGLLGARADADAIDYLQGHKLGRGSRDRYIDV